MHFTPTRAAGLARLAEFLPRAGRTYAAERNFDRGPHRRDNVSGLSPLLRLRLLTEAEVAGAALDQHGPDAARKFIEEVCWRTYWKGWLESHPAAWRDYAAALPALLAEAGEARAAASTGRTGIACFDAWVRELIATNYLHNHTRMWLASIWLHTLGLPWQLGAALFERHLLDGDPASNTLSWRWVAGLQTLGKTYLARPDNIARYTDGLFQPTGLATRAPPAQESAAPPAIPIPPPEPPPRGPVALLLTEEDLAPETLDLPPVMGIAALDPTPPPAGWAAPVPAFRAAAIADALWRAQRHFGRPGAGTLAGADQLAAWAHRLGCTTILTLHAPVGPTADRLDRLGEELAARDITLAMLRRPWDSLAWPHATRGYFGLRPAIPRLLALAAPASGLPLFTAAQ